MQKSTPANNGAVSRDMLLLCGAITALMIGFGIYQSTIFNFSVDKLGLKASGYGVVESIRELPGFLMVFVAALTMRMSESKLAGIALLVVAFGMFAYGFTGGLATFALFSFIWSIGFHTWMPLLSSMTLNLSKKGTEGRNLGLTNSVGSVAMLIGLCIVMIVGKRLGYAGWYFLAAGVIAIGAVIVSRVRCEGRIEESRFVIKKRYNLYYFLTFLEGCRKQVFLTFAPLIMVKIYHTSFQTIAALMIINSIVNMIEFPIVGRIIDKIGERKVLMFSYSLLVPVFIGYALLRNEWLLYTLYCMDNLLYFSSIGLTTYLKKISDPEDLRPSLSMGVTMNHLAAVIVPISGGLIWESIGYRDTFIAGAFVVIISLFAANRLPRVTKRQAEVNTA